MAGLRRGLAGWIVSYEYERFELSARAYRERRSRLSALRRWAARVTVAETAAASARFWLRRVLGSALRLWLLELNRISVLQLAADAWRSMAAARAHARWVHRATMWAVLDGRLRRAKLALRGLEVRISLRTWRRTAHTLGPLRRCVARWAWRMSRARALHRWAATTRAAGGRRRSLRMALHRKMHRALHLWRTSHAYLRRTAGRIGATSWLRRAQRRALQIWARRARRAGRLVRLVRSVHRARLAFKHWRAATRRRPLEPLGAPINLRTIRAMTWRECCVWLAAIGIRVSRSPPALLRTLKSGAPYKELIRRISAPFWVRHKVAAVGQPRLIFGLLQQLFDMALVVRVLGCQKLDVSSLEEGKALEHLELLACIREVLDEANAERLGGARD